MTNLKTTSTTLILHHGLLSARFQRALQAHAPNTIKRIVSKLSITPNVHINTTPYYTVITVDNIPTTITTPSKKLKGPMVSEGTEALTQFLNHVSMERADAFTIDVPQGPCYFVQQKPQEQSLWPTLQTAFMEAIQAPFHKRMYWRTEERFLWARPIHAYCVFWDQQPQTLPFPAYIPMKTTFPGHPILDPQEYALPPDTDIPTWFERHHIILSHHNRNQKIAHAMDQAKNQNLEPIATINHEDLALNTQYPSVLIGTIDERYAALGTPIVQHILQEKLSAIPMGANNTITHFAIVIDNAVDTTAAHSIIQGFQRVMDASLNDAIFFIEKDQSTPLLHHTRALQQRMIHNDIGSTADHTQRLCSLVRQGFHCEQNVNTLCQTIELLKCDLETLMVHEYPALQGIMGTQYAIKQGISPDVAQAIQEHYLPIGPTSPLPNSPLGAACAFLDKICTLVSFIGVGRRPTSSKDPFAIRRLTLGIIRIAKHHPWTHQLRTLISQYCQEMGWAQKQADILEFLQPFLQDRILHYAKSLYPAPIIAAATNHIFAHQWDIHNAFQIMHTLHTSPHTATIAQTYKRAANLTTPSAEYDPNYTPTSDLDNNVLTSLQQFTPARSLEHTLPQLSTLSSTLESFCDNTLIDARTPQEKSFRQALLAHFCRIVNQHFDCKALIL